MVQQPACSHKDGLIVRLFNRAGLTDSDQRTFWKHVPGLGSVYQWLRIVTEVISARMISHHVHQCRCWLLVVLARRWCAGSVVRGQVDLAVHALRDMNPASGHEIIYHDVPTA